MEKEKKEKRNLWKYRKYTVISIISVLTVLLIWYLVTTGFGLVSSRALPGPDRVFQTFIKKWTSAAPEGATLGTHIITSLKLALAGYCVGAVIGIPVGY